MTKQRRRKKKEGEENEKLFQLVSLLCGLGEPYEYHNLGEFTRNGILQETGILLGGLSYCEELVGVI